MLIVTGDDYPGHRWRETGPELASALRQDPRLEVSITESPAFLGSPLLSHYDAVLIHFKNYSERLPLGEVVWNGLKDYLNNGGGVLIAHFGCGAFQEWNDFVQYSGRVWNPKFRAHDPYGPFDVSIVDHDHAITKSLTDFSTTDELYTCLDGPTSIQVLCTAVSKVDQKPYPMGFVLEPGKGRVFHCTLGHDVNALRSEGTRALYLRAALWAVGLPKS
jgi:type 1 glutamine amidotransferase